MTGIVTVDGSPGADVSRRGYRDPGSGCAVLVTTPSADPQLWREYVAGAVRSYRAHDVERALDLEAMQDGRSSSLLFVMLSDEGETIAGMRASGPYREAERSHAYSEWAGDPGQAALRARLDLMVPEGLVETKTAWIADGAPDRRAMVSCLCRMPIHAATLLGARFTIGTAADFSVAGWTATGAVVAADVPAVPYPDDRYRTRLVWWDRRELRTGLTEAQCSALDEEDAELRAPLVPTQGHR